MTVYLLFSSPFQWNIRFDDCERFLSGRTMDCQIPANWNSGSLRTCSTKNRQPSEASWTRYESRLTAVPTYALHRNELNAWLKFAAKKSTAEMRELPWRRWWTDRDINDLLIGVRRRLRVRVFRTELTLWVWRAKISVPRARAQKLKLVLGVVLLLQSEGRY